MLWDKKGGWPFKVVIGLVLLLVVGGVLIYFVGGIYYEWMLSTFGGGERIICKKSVELNAERLSIGGLKVTDPFIDIKCEIIPLEIKEKDPEKIKRILADRLYWTWDDFGSGLKEIEEIGFIGDTYCEPRYAPISFENKVEIKDFKKFLASNKPKDKDESYLKLITGKEDISEFEYIPDTIDTTKEHSILFVISKKGLLSRYGLFGALGLLGEDFSTSLALIPTSEIVELDCKT